MLNTQPQNPKFIIADSDALLQILLTKHIRQFRTIKERYGIQLVAPERITTEIPGLIKIPGLINSRFQDARGPYDKALSNGTLKVLSEEFFIQEYGASGVSMYDKLEEQAGIYYNTGIGQGEAYVHGAALILDSPALTHDTTALQDIRRAKLPQTRNILRSFDVMGLLLQIDAIQESDCEIGRQVLAKHKERMPVCFRNTSFQKGLPDFYIRILDADLPTIGCKSATGTLDVRIYLKQIAA